MSLNPCHALTSIHRFTSWPGPMPMLPILLMPMLIPRPGGPGWPQVFQDPGVLGCTTRQKTGCFLEASKKKVHLGCNCHIMNKQVARTPLTAGTIHLEATGVRSSQSWQALWGLHPCSPDLEQCLSRSKSLRFFGILYKKMNLHVFESTKPQNPKSKTEDMFVVSSMLSF